ncbi:MAG TPA: ABC transporter substrate-binding protein [Thermoanaerobaculia bacterium]|nr:ABC transporter substrate-binding protein [Thermoanaerobaculia bacterium]
MKPQRRGIVFLCTALLAPGGALGQKADRIWRVGCLMTRTRPEPLDSSPWGAVPATLAELGYVEGKNLVIEWRFGGGDYTRLPALADELTRMPVDVIVADGTPGTRAAQGATKTIPIVFVGGGDVVADGLVKSLAHPGGNTTGCSLLLSDTAAKQLELLTAWVPKLSSVAVLFNPAMGSVLKGVVEASRLRRIRLLSFEAKTPAEIETALARAAAEKAEALVWLVDSFLFQQSRQIAELAAKYGLPSMSGYPEYADHGGLMGYGPNRRDLYRKAAGLVSKILKGANPADLPVEQPTRIDLFINVRTAKTLGLTIPPELLLQANKVIE